jgi:CubicO group peptidase (beta-lactamase class C family)
MTDPNRREFLRHVSSLMIAPAAAQASQRATTNTANSRFPQFAALEKEMPTLLERFRVPGAALAIVERGALSRATGFGVKKTGTSSIVTADTVFEAASLGKLPFAYHVLKLAERGGPDPADLR